MSDGYTIKDGRIWYQKQKFREYDLLLPYGMTDITDPVGSLTAVREPSATQRRASVVVDVVRGEPGLPGFTLETKLFRTLNFMLGAANRTFNFQAHLGELCDVPDNYYASAIGLAWEEVSRGDMSISRIGILEGDNVPIAVQVPWMAQIGPIPLDFGAEFLSPRTIAEAEAITGMAFLDRNCGGIGSASGNQSPGQIGYLATRYLGGSVGNVANVWYTKTGGEAWLLPSAQPFAGGETITSIVIMGSVKSHRVVVAGDKGNVSYCDVTAMGTTGWVTSALDSAPAQYITKMHWLNWNHLYAVTNDGYGLLSIDGGVTFDEKLTDGAVVMNGVTSHIKGLVYAVGDDEVVKRSKDFGQSWSSLSSPAAADMTAVHVTPDGTLFVGTGGGEIYGTVDDGAEWTLLPPQGITPTRVTDIKSLNNTEIWASVNTNDGSGRVLRSCNNGGSFRLWNLNLPENAGINALSVVDVNHVFAGGEPIGGMAFITKTNPTIIGL